MSLPEALYSLLAERGIDVDQSVLLNVSTAEQGCRPVGGLILTQAGRFIDFEADFAADGSTVLDVHGWKDVTADQDCASRNPGYGPGLGRLALDVQQQLHLTGES